MISRLFVAPLVNITPYDEPEIVPAFVTVADPPLTKTPREPPEILAPTAFDIIPPAARSTAAPLVAVIRPEFVTVPAPPNLA